jgi:hypothetical protein
LRASFAIRGRWLRRRRALLQQVGPHSAIVKWRGDAGRVCFSKKLRDLSKRNWPRCVEGVATAGGHNEAKLTGLAPKQAYFYSVAGQIDESQKFRTPPNENQTPKDGNTHIWIVGDSGTATEVNSSGVPTHPGEAAAVRHGFGVQLGRGEPADLFRCWRQRLRPWHG